MMKKQGTAGTIIGSPRARIANTQKFLSKHRKLFRKNITTKRFLASPLGMSQSSGGSSTLHRSQTYSAVAGFSSVVRKRLRRTAMPLLTKLHLAHLMKSTKAF
jgi:hypothetical protein